MKKAIVIMLIALGSTTAMAQHHGHGGYYRGGGNRWIAPLIIGSAIGYGLGRPNYEPYYAPPPVVYVPPPIVYQNNCTRYIYQDQYGQTIREETRCN